MKDYIRKKKSFLDDLVSNCDENIDTLIDNFMENKKKELFDYDYIKKVNELKIGHFIKYIKNEEIDKNNSTLKGGVITNIVDADHGIAKIITIRSTTSNFFWKISTKDNCIFLKMNNYGKLSKFLFKYCEDKNIDIDI